eukprot:2144318-Alexandrium_andersonii.AAC.1
MGESGVAEWRWLDLPAAWVDADQSSHAAFPLPVLRWTEGEVGDDLWLISLAGFLHLLPAADSVS